mmetsp:Transcript_30003/g.58871  ORF Transcript_30003/g.58871 Transcript_30003/m.58871 type:complete len:98 (-) Transcript_30003:1637-1930(-)
MRLFHHMHAGIHSVTVTRSTEKQKPFTHARREGKKKVQEKKRRTHVHAGAQAGRRADRSSSQMCTATTPSPLRQESKERGRGKAMPFSQTDSRQIDR